MAIGTPNGTEITWLGTAGFAVRSKLGRIAFDPFLSRSGAALPSPFKPSYFSDIESIFVGHGHFDHVYDIPEICTHGGCRVHALGRTAELLGEKGVPAPKIFGRSEYLHTSLRVRAHKSRHTTFDCALIWNTVKRFSLPELAKTAKLGLSYPKGETQGYTFESSGKKFLFLSTAGCPKEELESYRRENIDVILLPLQGHTNISKIAADIAIATGARTVIPHHHDDFFPPLSQEIKTDQLKFFLKQGGFKGEMLEIPLFGTINL